MLVREHKRNITSSQYSSDQPLANINKQLKKGLHLYREVTHYHQNLVVQEPPCSSPRFHTAAHGNESGYCSPSHIPHRRAYPPTQSRHDRQRTTGARCLHFEQGISLCGIAWAAMVVWANVGRTFFQFLKRVSPLLSLRGTFRHAFRRRARLFL